MEAALEQSRREANAAAASREAAETAAAAEASRRDANAAAAAREAAETAAALEQSRREAEDKDAADTAAAREASRRDANAVALGDFLEAMRESTNNPIRRKRIIATAAIDSRLRNLRAAGNPNEIIRPVEEAWTKMQNHINSPIDSNNFFTNQIYRNAILHSHNINDDIQRALRAKNREMTELELREARNKSELISRNMSNETVRLRFEAYQAARAPAAAAAAAPPPAAAAADAAAPAALTPAQRAEQIRTAARARMPAPPAPAPAPAPPALTPAQIRAQAARARHTTATAASTNTHRAPRKRKSHRLSKTRRRKASRK